VTICASCGHENSEAARFCGECGSPLAHASTPREQRKTVTVLFCDVTGSTALGESTDPEAVRSLLARYFERMKAIVEFHGGAVEKFIGDAVMAVFGVPQVHEDDAVRACRAAIEMRNALPELGVQARIGVNTGEVVTGTEERLATGDAVNVAARLEQAASPGEILLGEETMRLVRDVVEAETVEALELKGKAEPVAAHRLRNVHEAPERRHETRFVGRAEELELIHTAWKRARDEERCELVTIVGDAGVGKSRLAQEVIAGIEAKVVQGRCLSYGEGITYWPVVEVVKQLGTEPSDPAAAASLRALLGESEQGTSAEEIAWAFRKLLEEQAPIVCVFDDIHWAEDTFLDLVEHVALLSTGAPTILLCMARPELAERRSQWPVTLSLEPLPSDRVDELIPRALPEDFREKIAQAAGGNPLFVTEMVAMAGESEGDVAVPPSLQALLAARLDRLGTAERSVLERGAVEGEVFHRGAVQALSEDDRVTPQLAALVRRQLIRPDKPLLRGEDAFRFRHLLIRDAAYDALPKAARAELHERFAAWLAERGQRLVELDEILGYHLEQASRFKAELGESDRGLVERAAARLAVAGRRALWRGDGRAASLLLERALELARPLRLDVVLELDLAQALSYTDVRASADIAGAAAERAHVEGDEAGEMLARTTTAFHRSWFETDPDIDELEARALETLPLLEGTNEHAALVHVWQALGYGVANFRGRWGDWADAAEQALYHSRLAGGSPTELFGLGLALASSPRPADEALSVLDKVLSENPHPGTLLVRAWLLAMLGHSDEASRVASDASARLRDLYGLEDDVSGWLRARIEELHGDIETAVRYAREACEQAAARGQSFALSSFAPMLGRQLCVLGEYNEADRLTKRVRQLDVRTNLLGEALVRQVEARVLAYRGEHARAEDAAREAIGIIERTDGLNYQGDAYCDLAEVLGAAGRCDEAVDALEQALERYERKKNRAMVAQVRPKLEALRAGIS
jgi:class 3 adenylate cyclase/tetratricopeptide (TPR) repeat protein